MAPRLGAAYGRASRTDVVAAAAIRLASEKTGKSVDELNRVIANTNDVVLTANATLVDVHTDLHDTMKVMPHIMQQVDKTATNISKFSKISIIAGIISNLANGLIPACCIDYKKGSPLTESKARCF
jgi:hypothetical protein